MCTFWFCGLALYQRAIDVVDLEYACLPLPRDPCGLFVDASQGPGYAVAKYGVQCVHQNAMVFSYELQSLLRADHNLSLHGFPVPELELFRWSQSLLFKMRGDSYFLPNFGALELALFLNPFAPWWEKLERVVHRSPETRHESQEDGPGIDGKRARRNRVL